jgi:hypothetical protein
VNILIGHSHFSDKHGISYEFYKLHISRIFEKQGKRFIKRGATTRYSSQFRVVRVIWFRPGRTQLHMLGLITRWPSTRKATADLEFRVCTTTYLETPIQFRNYLNLTQVYSTNIYYLPWTTGHRESVKIKMNFYRTCISSQDKLWTWYVFARIEHPKLNQKWKWYSSRCATRFFHKRKVLSMAWSLYQLYLIEWVPSSGSGWVGLLASACAHADQFWRSVADSGDCSGDCCVWLLSGLLLPELLYSPFQARSQPWHWYSASKASGDEARWIRWSACLE